MGGGGRHPSAVTNHYCGDGGERSGEVMPKPGIPDRGKRGGLRTLANKVPFKSHDPLANRGGITTQGHRQGELPGIHSAAQEQSVTRRAGSRNRGQ